MGHDIKEEGDLFCESTREEMEEIGEKEEEKEWRMINK